MHLPGTLLDLSLDIKLLILEHLDNRSLAQLAQTCKYYADLVRSTISFRYAYLAEVDNAMPESPPYLNYRCGLAIDSTFYLPFIHDNSHCYSYNLKSGVWTIHKLNLIGTTTIDPQITRAAAVGSKIYLMGGRLLKKYVLSNTLIEMDTNTFDTRIIQNTTGTPPRPRHEHSVEVIQDRYLVVFGGLCYNSAGENDVFVFDILHNHWFVPPITGHVPHMRFGHASAVIGTDMYIHGGAQIDNVNRYIVYDDLYKLDCKTWVWYKYENPEVERYLRNQGQAEGEAPRKDYLIATTGCNPYDRFQSYICTNGNKLFIFGGHTIREDEYDNDVILSYPLDEITVFNTKRCCWSNNHLSSKGNSIQDDNPLIVSDISAAKVFSDAPILSIFIIAERNMPGALSLGNQPNESRVISSSSTNSGSSGNSSTQPQPGIFPADEDIEPLKTRSPELLHMKQPASSSELHSNDQSSSDQVSHKKERYRRPSLAFIHPNPSSNTEDGEVSSNRSQSSSDNSSYGSNSSIGFTRHRKTNYVQLNDIIACTVMIELIE